MRSVLLWNDRFRYGCVFVFEQESTNNDDINNSNTWTKASYNIIEWAYEILNGTNSIFLIIHKNLKPIASTKTDPWRYKLCFNKTKKEEKYVIVAILLLQLLLLLLNTAVMSVLDYRSDYVAQIVQF